MTENLFDFTFNVRKISNIINNFVREFALDEGIQLTEDGLRVLYYLKEKGKPVRVGDAQENCYAAANISYLVKHQLCPIDPETKKPFPNNLVLSEISKSDKRIANLSITNEGKKIIQEFERYFKENWDFSYISKECMALNLSLEKLEQDGEPHIVIEEEEQEMSEPEKKSILQRFTLRAS
jgi:hypothetical protein